MIEPLAGRLAGLVRRHNRTVREPARIQLRAAVHAGTVYHDEQGIAGDDVTWLCWSVSPSPAVPRPGRARGLAPDRTFLDPGGFRPEWRRAG